MRHACDLQPQGCFHPGMGSHSRGPALPEPERFWALPIVSIVAGGWVSSGAESEPQTLANFEPEGITFPEHELRMISTGVRFVNPVGTRIVMLRFSGSY